MAAPSAARSTFRARTAKVGAPSFRPGMGEIYRQLETEGVIAHPDSAEARAADAAQAERLRRARRAEGPTWGGLLAGLWRWLRALG